MDNFGSSTESSSKRQVLHGLCRACMQGDCTTKVILEDGVVVKIEGDPEMPPNYGSLCPRGNAEILALYNPYRIKNPLIRTNPEKGLDVDPGWKEVSWDEALEVAAKALAKVREEDPRGLIICEGWGQRDTILRNAFGRAFGTPNEIGSHGPLCTVHYATGLVQASFPVAIVDLEHCRYHVTLGRSLGPNFATASGTRKFAAALSRGMKLVVVDPRCSHEAAKGEWVPIKPSSDLAFLLSFAHVMLHENLQLDEWFLKNRTNAPYLVGTDGNTWLVGGKPQIWDAKVGNVKPFDGDLQQIALEGHWQIEGQSYATGFTLIKEKFAEYTPEWSSGLTGISPETVRRLAMEFTQAACIGQTIEIDGITFPFRPVSLNTERNVTNHRGGTYADLTGKLINMLVGALEVPGGCLSSGYRGPILAPGEDGVVKPAYEGIPHAFAFPPQHVDGREFFPHKHTSPHLAAKAILDPGFLHLDYQPKAWLNVGGNPIRQNGQPDIYVEAFKKMDFVLSIAYHADEPTWLADVVLPEHCALERLRVAVFYPQHQSVSYEVAGLEMVQIREPVLAVHNTRHIDDILMDLADRLGILTGEGGLYAVLNESEDFIIKEKGLNLNPGHKLDIQRRHSLEEIYDAMLRGWPHSQGQGLEELRAKGAFIHWNSPNSFYNYKYWPENTTRHPFYFQALKDVGDNLRKNLQQHNLSFPGCADLDYIFELYQPIPHWVTTSEFDVPGYDLWAINWKTPFFSSDASNVTGNPWLATLYAQDPCMAVICLNPVTAAAKKMVEADLVQVESRYGSVQGRVHISELFHPQAVGIGGCFGLGTKGSNPLNRRGPNFNSLISLDTITLDAVSAGQELAPAVRVIRL